MVKTQKEREVTTLAGAMEEDSALFHVVGKLGTEGMAELEFSLHRVNQGIFLAET